MSVAFIADLESRRDSVGGAGAKYIQTLDQYRNVYSYAHALLFHRVLLEQIRVHKRNALSAFRVLAADFETSLECTKDCMLNHKQNV